MALFQSETSPMPPATPPADNSHNTENTDTLDIFLKQHNLEDIAKQLKASGIENIDDLLELQTDHDAEQCADDDLKLSDDHEKKQRFIKAVRDLRVTFHTNSDHKDPEDGDPNIEDRSDMESATDVDRVIDEKKRYIVKQFKRFEQLLRDRQQYLLAKIDEMYQNNKGNTIDIEIDEHNTVKQIETIGTIATSNDERYDIAHAAEPLGLSHTKKIISIQIGQCGNRIGNEFWNSLYQEHMANGKQRDENRKVDVYFKEISESLYVPRAVAIDLDPTTQVTSLIPRTNTVFGCRSARGIWPCAMYTDGAELKEKIRNTLRYQLESCDYLQGINIFHSLNGATGSGVSAMVLGDSMIQSLVSKTTISTYSVVSSAISSNHLGMNNSILEPYNVVLGLNALIEASQTYSYLLSNNGTLELLKSFDVPHGNFDDINRVYSPFIQDMSSMFIYGDTSLNLTLESVKTHLVPKEKLKFLTMTCMPMMSNGDQRQLKCNEDIGTLAKQIWNPQYICLPDGAKDDKLEALSSLIVCRVSGDGRENEVNTDQINKVFGQYNEHSIRCICNVVPHSNKKISNSCANVINTPWIQTILWNSSTRCMNLFKKRHGWHHLAGEGLDEMELTEADSNIKSVCDAINDALLDVDDID
eukprot:131640_1